VVSQRSGRKTELDARKKWKGIGNEMHKTVVQQGLDCVAETEDLWNATYVSAT